MKDKVKMASLVVVVLLLFHFLLVVGCGRNPLIGALLGNMTVKVVKI